MTRLSAEIERTKAIEFERAEAAMAARISASLAFSNPALDEPTRFALGPFIQWCASQGVRHCPARPATVAEFILAQADAGVVSDRIRLLADSIEAMHDHFGLPNPTTTAIVRRALECAVEIEPPRWPRADKISFARLPADIRAAIARRETQRDNALRLAQNEAGRLRHKLTEEHGTAD